MDYMKNLPEDYDIIVLDPPAFAKHRDKRHQAITKKKSNIMLYQFEVIRNVIRSARSVLFNPLEDRENGLF
jgi:23S rRNA G2069 N7-methylase RlmK/C1962 C5-methylase RlmI